jgi:signal transduction histidine kinase
MSSPDPRAWPGWRRRSRKTWASPAASPCPARPTSSVPRPRLALYRVAQEALTNITKYAHPQRVELHLAYEPSATRLIVEDFTTPNGSRPPVPGADSSGYGLTGMRERAELLGGTLTAKPSPGGFRVELEVPR